VTVDSLHATVYSRVVQMKFISEMFWAEEKRPSKIVTVGTEAGVP
jgi:hypothetical protein